MPGLYDLVDQGVDVAATATFWIRALARIIDSVVTIVATMPAVMVAALIFVIARGPDETRLAMQAISGGFLLPAIIGTLATALYHSCSEYIGGASIGKLLCGLRVVSEDLSPVTLRGAVVRSIAYVWDGFFFGYIGYRSMDSSVLNQRNGDVWGSTLVVRLAAVPNAGRGAARVALGIVAGLSAMAAFLTVAFLARMTLRV